jgi:1-acyl-sn-glycerol-3-phosphate acyltransferase
VLSRTPNLDPVQARSPQFCRLAGLYMRRYMARNFHAVRISKSGRPRLAAGRPAIIYSNHPSWWDPALFIVLNTTWFAERPGYGPMDAAALDKYRFMRRIGIFGIEPETRRGARQFLRTALRILNNRHAILWVTAQGAFTDARARPVCLRPGVAHLAKRLPDAVLVPLAIEYPFWDERYPEALCRFGEPLHTGRTGADLSTVQSWQRTLELRLSANMEALAAEAMTRDPRRFEVLVRGAAGVGGIYDAWRRTRARLRGQHFRSEHGESEG